MPFYFRFRAGPIGFSHRLGRTKAQKRAAAKAGELRRNRRSTPPVTGTVRYWRGGPLILVDSDAAWRPGEYIGGDRLERFAEGTRVELRLRPGGGSKVKPV